MSKFRIPNPKKPRKLGRLDAPTTKVIPSKKDKLKRKRPRLIDFEVYTHWED